jgi:GrpB-like predicted nucleotidyltransferase (UPF0157 family)
MSDLPIRTYQQRPPTFEPWDPRAADVASELARLIGSAWPGAVAHHLGSTAVPGMPGRNIVDLALAADPDDVPAVVDALRSLGFEAQSGIAAFPPTRPMLQGTVVHGDAPFRVHVHVIPPARDELRELLAFRDALRSDAALRDAYADAKLRLVAVAPGPGGAHDGVQHAVPAHGEIEAVGEHRLA